MTDMPEFGTISALESINAVYENIAEKTAATRDYLSVAWARIIKTSTLNANDKQSYLASYLKKVQKNPDITPETLQTMEAICCQSSQDNSHVAIGERVTPDNVVLKQPSNVRTA